MYEIRLHLRITRKLIFFQGLESFEIDQCLILSTCNRSERFCFYEREQQSKEIWN